MHRLFEFLRSVYVVVLFIVLEAIAINFYAHSNLYTQAKMLSYSNRVVGSAQGVLGGVRGYFGLKSRNDILLQRVEELERELSQYRYMHIDSTLWANSLVGSNIPDSAPYSYVRAKVVSNTINRSENFMVINRGERDGVVRNMAVVSSGGAMVGYIAATSERYSIAISILNTQFKSSGKIAGQEHMGSIFWSADSRYQVNMEELSKYATLNVGDSIISTGHSQIFPEGIPIGTIASFEMNRGATAYNVKIDLACDISALNEVLIIGNNNYGEVDMLLRETIE